MVVMRLNDLLSLLEPALQYEDQAALRNLNGVDNASSVSLMVAACCRVILGRLTRFRLPFGFWCLTTREITLERSKMTLNQGFPFRLCNSI